MATFQNGWSPELKEKLHNPSLTASELERLIPHIDTSIFSPVFSLVVAAFERVGLQATPQLGAMILDFVSKTTTTFDSSSSSEMFGEEGMTFIASVLRIVCLTVRKTCSHIKLSTPVTLSDPEGAAEDILGNLLSCLCHENSPLLQETLSEHQIKSVILFLDLILNLCHFSVCPSQLYQFQSGIAGKSWKAYRILILKLGKAHVSRLQPDRIVQQWGGILAQVHSIIVNTISLAQSVPSGSNVRYMKYCISVLIAVIQVVVAEIKDFDRTVVPLLQTIILFRTDLLPSQNPRGWSRETISTVSVQLAAPFDRLFFFLVSSLNDNLKWKSFSFFDPQSSLEVQQLSFESKMVILLSFFSHNFSFPNVLLRQMINCLDWILKSPVWCYQGFMESSTPKATPLFYQAVIGIINFLGVLQESDKANQGSSLVGDALVCILGYVYHKHFLTREIVRQVWLLFLQKSDDKAKSLSREILLSMIEQISQKKSSYSRQILLRLTTTLIPLCFSNCPFPLELRPSVNNISEIEKLLEKLLFVPLEVISDVHVRCLCDAYVPLCIRVCDGTLRRGSGSSDANSLDVSFQLFLWVFSSPRLLQMVPIFSRQKVSEIVLAITQSTRVRPSTSRYAIRLLQFLFPHFTSAQQLTSLTSLQNLMTKEILMAEILRVVEKLCPYLKDSKSADLYRFIFEILSKGLSSSQQSIRALALLSSLELLACSPFETQYILSSFGENEAKVRNFISSPPLSDDLNSKVSGYLGKSASNGVSRKRKIPPSSTLAPVDRRSSGAPTSLTTLSSSNGTTSYKMELQQFIASVQNLEKVLPSLPQGERNKVLSQMRGEISRVASRYGK